MSSIKSRLAPTPSGYLHIGNIYSFVLSWLQTRSRNGRLLLRIDDMDGPRVRREYLDDIFETLAFIGLDWDEGPENSEDFFAHYSQQHRMEIYEALLTRLLETGLIYACTCSRKTLSENACNCFDVKKDLQAADAAWKIKLPENTLLSWKDDLLGMVSINLNEQMGDFVLRRKDGLPAYQLCSLADDIHFGVNYVVRGQDLLASTAAQLWLADLLQLEAFKTCHFFHHPLIKDESAQKLSKSAGAGSVKAFREAGGKAAELLQQIAPLPGIDISEPVNNLSELLALFKAQKI